MFLMTAKNQKDRVAGLGWDGYIGDAGFRGEFTYTKNGKTTYPRIAVGCDYSFWRKLYTIIEYFYNGAANGDMTAFASNVKLARNLLSVKKQLISLMARYDVTGVLQVRGTAIYDIEGKSVFLNPEIRYNVFKDSDVICGAQLFAAPGNSEFTDYKDLYYIEFKHYF
jgi:hypothetical protein